MATTPLFGGQGAGQDHVDLFAHMVRQGLGELIWDAYLSNYRRAAYDEWDAQALSDHMGKQIDVILAGAIAAK